MRKLFALLIGMILLALCNGSEAAQTGPKTIHGRWCNGQWTLYVSSRQWKIIENGAGPTLIMKVARTVYLDDHVQLFAFYQGSYKQYDFVNFKDGTMSQVGLQSTFSFRRC